MTETQVKEKTKLNKVDRVWYIVDAKNKVLGRMATRIATVLMGKHKPIWQPYLDLGDNIIIINASKIKVTGRKEEQKIYYRYSGYPGGLKSKTLGKLRASEPEKIIYDAVRGMLPKNRLARQVIKKLFVYPGEKHPHEAQKPQELGV